MPAARTSRYSERSSSGRPPPAPPLTLPGKPSYLCATKPEGGSQMNGTRDTSGTTAAGNGDGFDPQEAATLLEQAKRQARRQFEATPPWLSLIQAVVVLGAYGAIWLSVRGQHPYQGPSGVVLLVYVLVIVAVRAFFAARKRAVAGVGVFVVLLGRAAATAWLQRA
jgi:hypothetical protein